MTYIFYKVNTDNYNKEQKATFTPPSTWSGDYQGIKDILDTKHGWSVLDGQPFDYNNPEHVKKLPIIFGGTYVWCEKSKRVVTKSKQV
jgi:hypothetical protein